MTLKAAVVDWILEKRWPHSRLETGLSLRLEMKRAG
jgi:hypothetical protein